MKFALRLAIEFIAVMMIGSVMTINASARSLPGDPLYGVKRTWEEVRLTLTLNDPARQQLQDQFRQLRLDEVREMIQRGRTGMVEFEGQLESIAAGKWMVSGIQVIMQPDTIVDGNPEIGQMVLVMARLQNNGTLTAVQVLLPNHHMDSTLHHTPLPTPVPTYTRWPTHEPTQDHHDDTPPSIHRPNNGHLDNGHQNNDRNHDGCCCCGWH